MAAAAATVAAKANKPIADGAEMGPPPMAAVIGGATNPMVTPLLTDQYQFTMAYAYWKAGKHRDHAVFDLFFRKNPFGGEYTVFGGLEECIRFIANFKFKEEDISFLRSVMPTCEEGFFEYLKAIDCSDVEVYAISEGSVVSLARSSPPPPHLQSPPCRWLSSISLSTRSEGFEEKKMPTLEMALPPELTNSVIRLYRECLRRARFVGHQQHNTPLVVDMVRQQFKRNMHETDPEKIEQLKDAARRGLINHMLHTSEEITGRKSSKPKGSEEITGRKSSKPKLSDEITGRKSSKE